MSDACVRHPMTVAEFACGTCGYDFCPECVVFPHGLKKPPMCISCALDRGGVRRRETGRPKLGRREIKLRLDARRQRTTVTRTEFQQSRLGQVVDPLPSEDETQTKRWMDGERDAEEFPGGWSQKF